MREPSRSERTKSRVFRDALGFFGFLLALALTTAPIGCANQNSAGSQASEPESEWSPTSLADAPGWVTEGCRVHWPNEEARRNVVCGVGSAKSNRNRLAARETAVARARSAIARSIEVTIESLVQVEDRGSGDGEMRSIVHQLTSASLPSCQLESVWQARTGEIHALVSLQVAKVQQSVRNAPNLAPAAREDLARRAAAAFAAMDATFVDGVEETSPERDGSE